MICNDDISAFCAKLLEACKEYRLQLDYVEMENRKQAETIARLTLELQSANQCLEDVCTGAGLECPVCGKQRPCCCMDLGEEKK
jgi:hypothetical protein